MSAPAGQTRLATLLLVGVTAVWGSTFFLIRDLVETVAAGRLPHGALRHRGHRHVRALPAPDPRAGAPRPAHRGRARAALRVAPRCCRRRACRRRRRRRASSPAPCTSRRVLTAVLLREKVAGDVARSRSATVGLARALAQGFSSAPRGPHAPLGRACTPCISSAAATARARSRSGSRSCRCAPSSCAVPCRCGSRRHRPAERRRAVGVRALMVVFASILALWAQTWAQAHLPATQRRSS